MKRFAAVREHGGVQLSCAYSINWGSVPDWLAGLGTVASVVVIGTQLVREVKRRRIDDERLADERRDSEARQARSISSTVIAAAEGQREVDALVINGSGQQITDIVVRLCHEGADIAPPLVPDGLMMFVLPDGRSLSLLAPGQHLPVSIVANEPLPAGPYAVTVVEFTDATGIRWRKAGHNPPERMT